MPRKEQVEESGAQVAIIGGGVSGLALARQLAQAGIKSCVFDTGQRTAGGRCSSRRMPTPNGGTLTVDHAVQAFGAKLAACSHETQAFFGALERTERIRRLQDGELRIFAVSTSLDGPEISHKGSACHDTPFSTKSGLPPLSSSGDLSVLAEVGAASSFLYVSNDAELGVGVLPSALLAGDEVGDRITVKLGAWVDKISWTEAGWWLSEGRGWLKSPFRYIVFAHCGKCATRLINTAEPVWGTHAHAALKCRFVKGLEAPAPDKLDIVSTFAVVVEMHKRGHEAFDGASVVVFKGDPVLSMATNNTRKYGQKIERPTATFYDVWTLLSTAEFASANKCAQEHIPEDVKTRVAAALTQRFLDILEKSSPGGSRLAAEDVFRLPAKHVQLWGASLPANALETSEGNQGFMHDAYNGIGVVGDWLDASVSGTVEGAIDSGMRLGKFLVEEKFLQAKAANSSEESRSKPRFIGVQSALLQVGGERTDVGSSAEATNAVEDKSGKADGAKKKRWGKNKT